MTSRPGDAAAKVIEIGYYLHAPAQTLGYNRTGLMIGIFVDEWGTRWTVTKRGRFVTITPTYVETIPKGGIDMNAMLRFLRVRGVITGEEWFNGLAFGTEPTVGAGATSLKVIDWRVTYN